MTDTYSAWQEVANRLTGEGIPVLGSVLGTALGGPVGAQAGQHIGSMIANVLGVAPKPHIILEEINSHPKQAILTLENWADNNQTMLWAELAKYQAQASKEVQLTMRQELVSGNLAQKLWRPANGFVLAFASICLTVTAIIALFLSKTAEAQIIINALLPVLAILGGVVGVSAWGRSQEKHALLKNFFTSQTSK